MSYRVNPKLEGSGIFAAIPQKGMCPNGCTHCFFQSGRSYLEPLDENLPNLPPVGLVWSGVVRMNDGNDSNVDREIVLEAAKHYPHVFFNTAIPEDLEGFPGPVVLTINPGMQTDHGFTILEKIPENLMFIRIRSNTWNLLETERAVEWYTSRKVPVVLTFMAYYSEGGVVPRDIPEEHISFYQFRKRTLNEYWAITRQSWKEVMGLFRDNLLVYSCGNEGLSGNRCATCGNCLREYFATRERMKG